MKVITLHRQETKTVNDYVEKFHRLGARPDSAENEHHLIARFIRGLCADIKENIKLQPLDFSSEAKSLA